MKSEVNTELPQPVEANAVDFTGRPLALLTASTEHHSITSEMNLSLRDLGST
jgi:hypothetical protein